MRNAGADDAVGAVDAVLGIVKMHASAASGAAAGGLGKEFGHEGARGHALGQRVTVAAVGAGDPIGILQVG